ncbi:general secretion pathway protein GspK [Paracidovorax citrulli]|nr:general secretion pathway protein GspK [Paracidovorax citrulli]UEG46948.1 general secretion pathway protein GspK [Paracidovorax citrulli]WIY30090.1 general secretion pathway protein GspK [Paracidovorax citrulli]WIY35411.1 general secretion pathway protein GspK [Paracidovorax citrulli]WIY39310.1 general secretion pathway protein GspK [Paracidovorax citrulli]
MALIAVLWIVASLSIIVTGVTRTIREEARMMALARQNVQAQALGDAAIQLALQAIVANNTPINRMLQSEIRYGGVAMQVRAMPLNGLIDINSAPVPLLAKVYAIAGGVPAGQADALAQATVQVREQRGPAGLQERFESEEDLLKVPGIDYGLYARLFPLVTADLRGRGLVNPLAAPVEVLTVLASGNAAAARVIADKRDAGEPGVDTSALDSAFLDSSSVRRIRMEARVPMPDGTWLRVSRSVDLTARARDGAPWYSFRTGSSVEPVVRNP